MVGRNQCYHGSTQTPLLYHYNTQIIQVYKGSELIYQIGFDPITILPGASLQAWTVPVGVTKIHVDCVASSGYGSTNSDGKGGRVECDLTVTAGQTLYFTVGQKSTDRQTAQYNASDIRTNNAGITDSTSLQSRLVVAGGGGNQATSHNGTVNGGNGGGLTGASGVSQSKTGYSVWYERTITTVSTGGGGGTQSAGGARGTSREGGRYGSAGSFGMGANAPGGNAGYGAWGYAGAGGAGYYGGGSGGWDGAENNLGVAAGGGGGSSYTDANLCSNVTHTQGYQNGDGYITISFVG